MPTPQELAHAAEQYDEEQWFEFLDELDAVSRRRQQRDPAAPAPAGADRDRLALWIAKKHLAADSSIRKVLYLPKGAPADEIHLLEVNGRLALPEAERGRIEPIEFGLNVEGAPIRLFVADITSEQLDAIKAGSLALPAGWDLDGQMTTGRRA
jgi:hypothetical protein